MQPGVRQWWMVRAAACLALAGLLTVAPAGEELIPVHGAEMRGRSIPVSYVNGGSAYSGIGRYDGLVRCTAFFLDTAASFIDPADPSAGAGAPAYALTEGRCAARLEGDTVLLDGPGQGRVVFNYFHDSELRQLSVPVARTAYATASGRSFAVLELATPYAVLVKELIRPWPLAPAGRILIGDPVAVVGVGATGRDDFLRLAFCRIDGIAPAVVEEGWRWLDAPFNRCRDVGAASVGAPVLSITARAVIGLVSTTTAGADKAKKCAIGHPCEQRSGGVRSQVDTHYVSPLAGVDACFNASGRFNIGEVACPLTCRASARAATPDREIASSAAFVDSLVTRPLPRCSVRRMPS